jgi:endonuclease/exonuclease/phosphatase family metal-dependent hydrolase
MTNLFKSQRAEFWQGASRNKGMGSKPKNVQNLCEKISSVINEVKPDILGIQEGPPLKKQMELFNRAYLNDEFSVYSMPHGSQSVHTLVRKGIDGFRIEQVQREHNIYKHLNQKLEYYLWGDVTEPKKDSFSRRPVVLSLTHLESGEKIEIMTLHTKSKISKLKSPNQWENRDEEAINDALRSRQKLSAEMMAVRRYLTHAILSKRVKGCIVMGDLNDGINREIFERHFLLQNIVDELRGSFKRQNVVMHHALSQKYLQDRSVAYTSDFNDPTEKGKKIHELLDHILFSTECFLEKRTAFKIDPAKSFVEHDIFDKYTDNKGKARDDRPSDHKPISAILEYR